MEGWNIPAFQLAALVTLTVVSTDIVRRLIRTRIERKGYPLPPGPLRLPVFGNALSIRQESSFKTFTEWAAKYGDIMFVRLFDQDVVLLNSLPVITELLEKRSQIYSDRPAISTVDPYGHDSNLSLVRYGEHWRLCRRIFHQTFRAEVVVSFHPIQLRVARQLVLNVMEDPNGYSSHYSTFGAAISMRSVYDYDLSPRNDRMVSIFNDFMRSATPGLAPQRSMLVDTFPFLLHVPDWLPGSWIQREARVARELGTRMVETPYQYVQERMKSKEGVNPSMVSDHITRMKELQEPYRSEYEKALKVAATTSFLGSVDTTMSSLMSFTLAMVQNPRVWKRAQADIDAVVGTDRLPEFDDRSSLPYIDAILRETFRWQPPAPLVTPHATTTSDIYNGFYIPKGATIIPNVWVLSRDETRYPNAEEFIPERYLDTEGRLINDKPDFIFGFGRRICPGRHTANEAVWIAMVTMLATLNFDTAKDADGKDIPFEPEFIIWMARHLLTFPCQLTPRPHISKTFLEQALAK